MSASRFFGSFGAPIFWSRHHYLAAPRPPIRFANPHRYCSSAVASDCAHAFPVSSENPANAWNHPWPEWASFVDCLKTKGYLTESRTASSPGDIASEGNGNVFAYADRNILKNACLNFGRDRFDILKMLSTQDMQAVVEKGCPNLFRKAVNSAKRLRVYLQIDEGHACGACNLRGSCDRAYVLLKELEGDARTVDIVRILLLYALDPLVISGGEKPPGRELIDASVRKLLLELIELSETPLDPNLTKPTPKAFLETKRSSDSIVDEGLESNELKNGHLMRREINTHRKVGKDDAKMEKGDWICSRCNFMNFSRNMQCLKCRAEAPERFTDNDIEMKKGDWKCITCTFINFASRSSCKRCAGPRPKRQLNPGEWECPSCDFLNYRNNMVCKKCNHDRPRDLQAKKQYEDQLWKKPY
ncbi:zinc finger protein VAR3, chloroplastic [Ipomoea triloba]|uniref:zinc finger protein VAR3, chloroplastic n=1 Tax=Ipomoea triloba TaxID=35885 RepID=UPI00125DC95A|nr:zinc finger protein VAR3, chloroplastic [Ipomoea triloba]